MAALSAALAFLMISTVSVNQQHPVFEPETSVVEQIESEWGVLARLAGTQWRDANGLTYQFDWEEPGRVLVWQYVDANGQVLGPHTTFTRDPATGRIEGAWHTVLIPEVGQLVVQPDGRTAWVIGRVLTWQREFILDGDTLTIHESGRMHLPLRQTFARIGDAPEGRGAAPDPAPDRRGGPIVIASGSGAPAPVEDQARPQSTPAPPASLGPIVIASAPPPAAAMRDGPGLTSGEEAPSSREALMQAQIDARRIQAAQEAEAERIRLAQIAEQQRQAEALRRAEQAERERARSEWLGMAGALTGGLITGYYTEGDMTSITAGMAAGSAIAAPDSEMAAAANTVFQEEYQRYEAERAFEQQVIAELHNPDNPLTQQFAAEEEARRQQAEANRLEAETLEREAREEADRYALERERMAERETYEAQAELDRQREEDAQRARQLRDEEEARQREYEAEERAREEEARRQEAERLRLAREEEQRREAEARRLEQERIEAERHRLVDFREAVVICDFSGNQAQFGNWDCEGPLQQNYVNFERGNVDSAMNLMSCRNYRELPRSGQYRVFGCGYGLHPTNPGALRNVPEMMGVFVDGRAIFRCPISSSEICRER